MKKLVCATALILGLTVVAANAGGLVPVVPEVVVVEDTAASNAGIFVPIFALALLILLHAS